MNRLLNAGLFVMLALYASWFTFSPRPEPNSGDQFYYLYASRTLRHGDGLRNFPDAPPEVVALSGEPNGLFATWTPGYPALLALFDNPLVGAWVINALALSLSVVVAYGLARDFDMPRLVAFAIAGAWLISPPAQYIYRQILTEGIFVAVSLVWLRALVQAKERGQVLLLSVCSMGLIALRYSGALYVVFAAVVVFYAMRGTILQRLERTAAFMFLPAIFITWWLTRNWYSLGSLTGHRLSGAYDRAWSTLTALDIMLGWIPTILLMVGGAVCVGWLWRRWYSFTSHRSLGAELTPSSTNRASVSLPPSSSQ